MQHSQKKWVLEQGTQWTGTVSLLVTPPALTATFCASPVMMTFHFFLWYNFTVSKIALSTVLSGSSSFHHVQTGGAFYSFTSPSYKLFPVRTCLAACLFEHDQTGQVSPLLVFVVTFCHFEHDQTGLVRTRLNRSSYPFTSPCYASLIMFKCLLVWTWSNRATSLSYLYSTIDYRVQTCSIRCIVQTS